METVTATWITAVATAIYSLTVLFTVIYVVRQWKETRLLREAAVIKDVYDYIIRTHADRQLIYENQEAIRSIATIEQFSAFGVQHPDVANAIHEVANCYHYLGFLMKNKLLTSRDAVLEEGGRTVLSIHGIIGHIIKLQQRQSLATQGYKQGFVYLANEVRKHFGSSSV